MSGEKPPLWLAGDQTPGRQYGDAPAGPGEPPREEQPRHSGADDAELGIDAPERRGR